MEWVVLWGGIVQICDSKTLAVPPSDCGSCGHGLDRLVFEVRLGYTAFHAVRGTTVWLSLVVVK